MADNKLAYALIDLYTLLYNEKYRQKPKVNKYKLKWGFSDCIDDLGYDEAVEVMKFFFDYPPPHDPDKFLYNYEKFHEDLIKHREDKKRAEEVRQRTKERVNNVKDRGTSNQFSSEK